jgi:lipid A ethanolaminephosphotransferase
MNGYHRKTMPRMEQQGVISFPKVFSPYTHTAPSLMYILSRAEQDSLNAMYQESSFVDIFKACSFRTAWLGNQNPVRTFRYFVNECDTVYINKPQLSDFSNLQKLDSDLIEPFSGFIQESNARQLAIIHLAGNHWWYNKNFPDSFAVFKPILQNKVASSENKERMINSYDNVTLFVDFVIDSFMEELGDKNAMLIFLADHGQSFGEDGKWLHANNKPAEQNPACFIWLSDKYKKNYPNKVEALKANQFKEFDTAFLFHTIIHGSNIISPYLKENLSLFSPKFQRELARIDSQE